MPNEPLNLVVLKQADFEPAEFLNIQQEIAKRRGVRIGDETYLIPGDFSALTFWLYKSRQGRGHEVIYIFPLSYQESRNQQDRFRLLLAPLVASHLAAEFESLGLPIPEDVANTAALRMNPPGRRDGSR